MDSEIIDHFIEQLVTKKVLLSLELNFEGYPDQVRYIKQEATLFEIAISIKPNAYLSHTTASYCHGLINTFPKIIYVSVEQSKKNYPPNRTLTQQGIDAAFKKNCRVSHSRAKYENKTIVMLNPMYTGQIGIVTQNEIRIISLERTLIDCTVRPQYARGVSQVLELYKKAASRISIQCLHTLLISLNFIYPYHQAIGWYLSQSGFESTDLKGFADLPMLFDFYLDYEMSNKNYCKEWKIYYPHPLQSEIQEID